MKTFTTCAEKKAKQFLNLLQGYTKGIRMTAILILLLMGVSNAWAGTYYYSGQGNGTNWSKKAMTVSADGFYEYYLVSSTTTHQFKIGTSSNQYAYNKDYVSKNFNGTNIANIGDHEGDNCYCWQDSKHYILVYKPNTTVNNTSKPIICAATYLPDNRECTIYFVNKESWNTVNAYGWYYQNSTDGSNNSWPGKTMTNTGKTYNGKQIWSYTYPQTYDKAIFNNGSSQTSDLTLGTTNKEKMYDYPNSQWIAYTYDVKVTFNANGHGTAPTAKTVLKGGKVSAPTAPTATGYTFGGWYKESNCANAFDFNTAINADITLYAKWTANTNTAYTVKHYKQLLNGTYSATPDETENLTGTTDASVTPAVKSYTGFTAPSAQTVTIKADGSLVVTYKYTRNKHTLSWNLDGGDITEAGTAAGEVAYGATLTAPTVQKDGHTFTGWSPAVPETMPDNNVTCTAQWTAKTYTVNLDQEGATTPGTNSTTVTYGQAMPAIALPTPADGYAFMGYWDGKDGSGTQYYDAAG